MLVTDYPIVSVPFSLPKGVEVRKAEKGIIFFCPEYNLHVECEDNPTPATRRVAFSQMAGWIFNKSYPAAFGEMFMERAKANQEGQEEPLWVTKAFQAKAALDAQFLCAAQ